MGTVARLASRAWAKPLSGKRLKARHPISRMSARWFLVHGPLRAHVDLEGALTFEHDEPIPAWVMRDLSRARIIFFDGRQCPAKELPDQQFLADWLIRGTRAESLECHRPDGKTAPLATALCLIIKDGKAWQQICEIPYYDDERLLQRSRLQTSGGQTTQR